MLYGIHLNTGFIDADDDVTVQQTVDGSFTNEATGTIDVDVDHTFSVKGGSCVDNGTVTGAGTFLCP